jgi:RimJ/RimL family protein N-acetyltransferase
VSAAARRLPEPEGASFARLEPGVARFTLRPLEPAADAALVHRWVTSPHAGFWNMADKTREEIEAFYAGLTASGHALAELGSADGRPAFLTELYDPRHDQVGEHYAPAPGDRGMHVLVGPAETRVAGFTLGVMRTIMARLFADPAVSRVVVEPDIRNDRIHALNRKVGFVYDRPVRFREKTAHLAFCTRDAFLASLQGAAS